MLGLLPGIPSLAQTSPVVVQAAQPDQPHVAAPAGGLAGAVPSADHGPTHDLLDGAVVSSGAPDERLDVSAALDQGRRLFSLEARYQGWRLRPRRPGRRLAPAAGRGVRPAGRMAGRARA